MKSMGSALWPLNRCANTLVKDGVQAPTALLCTGPQRTPHTIVACRPLGQPGALCTKSSGEAGKYDNIPATGPSM